MSDNDPYFEIRKLIEQAGSKIFTVKFFKADGTQRVMKVQQAVAKFNVTGGRPEATKARRERNPNLLNVWDIENNGFRSVNMDTLFEIHMNGVVYRVSDKGHIFPLDTGVSSAGKRPD